jgi:hypothetical protein
MVDVPRKQAEEVTVTTPSGDITIPAPIPIVSVQGTLISDYHIPEVVERLPDKADGDGYIKDKMSGRTFVFSRVMRPTLAGEVGIIKTHKSTLCFDKFLFLNSARAIL